MLLSIIPKQESEIQPMCVGASIISARMHQINFQWIVAIPFRGELPNPVCLPREFFFDPPNVVFLLISSFFADFNLLLRYLGFV